MTDRPRGFLDWLPFLWSRVLFPAAQTAPTGATSRPETGRKHNRLAQIPRVV